MTYISKITKTILTLFITGFLFVSNASYADCTQDAITAWNKVDLAKVKRLADEGCTSAQNIYSQALRYGVGIKKNIKNAKFYAKLSADKENPEGLFFFGTMLLEELNNEEGLKYIRASANRNFFMAQLSYGVFMLGNNNLAESKKYLKMAASNDPAAKPIYNTVLQKGLAGYKDTLVQFTNLVEQVINKNVVPKEIKSQGNDEINKLRDLTKIHSAIEELESLSKELKEKIAKENLKAKK